MCSKNLNCASSTIEGGGGGGLVREKLKLFGNRTDNSTSLYNMKGVKKTSNFLEKAKPGSLPKQTGEPMRSLESIKDLEPPAIPQWLVELRKKKEVQPMATKPANHRE